MIDPYKTAAQHRDTPLHLISLRVDAAGVYVVCAIRDATPDVIPDATSPVGSRLQAKRVPEGLVTFAELSDEENAQLRAVCIMLETKRAAHVVAYQSSPERQASKVSEALDAENRLRAAKEEAERIAVEAEVERKRLAIEAQAARDEHAAMMADLDAKLAAKRAALEATPPAAAPMPAQSTSTE